MPPSATSTESSTSERRPVLVRGRLLTADAAPVADGLVLLLDGKVEYAGPAARAPRAPGGTEEIDAGDGTVLPGLVDAHVHLTCDGGPRLAAEVEGTSPEALALKAAVNAARHLERGIVAVRDLGAPGVAAIAVGRAVAEGRFEAAEVAAAGKALTAPGGHIPFLGLEVAGHDEMIAAAHAQLQAGAAGIKLVATGGILTEGVPLGNTAYEEDDLAAAAGAARSAGCWVAAHAIGEEGTKRALRAGATTIEHGVLLDEEAIELMRSKGALLVPTLVPILRIVENGRDGGIPDDAVDKAESVMEAHLDSVRRAARAGVPIAAGTDAGTPFNPHGHLADEVALLVEEAGLDLERSFLAATREAARCMGREDLGHLTPGVPGNLVIVDGDPTEDVTALSRVRAVVRRGGRVRLGPGAIG